LRQGMQFSSYLFLIGQRRVSWADLLVF